MPTRPAGLVALLGLVVLLAQIIGCSSCRRSHEDDGTTPIAQDLPKLEVRDDTPDLHLTWIDAKGNFHVAQHPLDVPIEARDAVRVYVASKEEGTKDLFWVCDLRTKNPDGAYPVATMPRSEWDALGEMRRAKTMAAAAPSASVPRGGTGPTASESPPGVPPSSRLSVIIYGAPWCEACHEAARYLRRKGITVVEKNIDDDDAAKREMQRKLARAGLRDSASVPVIDVRGRILLGFSPKELDRAVAEVTRGEEL